MGKRIKSIDVAKGIAIIAIIMGHLGYTSIFPNRGDTIATAVFQFHVPVFFILSGYTLNTKKPIRSFVSDRARRLLIPYWFTCLIVFLILVSYAHLLGRTAPPSIYPRIRNMLIAALYGAGSPNPPLPVGVMHIGAIWFLEALFIALCEIRLVLSYSRVAAIPVALLAFGSAVAAQYVYPPFNIFPGLIGGFYVYIGYLMKKRRSLEREVRCWHLIPTLTVFLIALYFKINVSVIAGSFGKYWLGLPVSLSSSYLCIQIAELVSSHLPKMTRLLSYFGINSLVILSIHLVFLDCGLKWSLYNAGVPTNNNILYFINFSIQLLLAYAYTLLVNGNAFLRSIYGINEISHIGVIHEKH